MKERWGGRSRGRGVADLLADFGHELPMREPAVQEPPAQEVMRRAPFGGPRRRGHGWTWGTAPVRQYRMTSDQLPAMWPLISSPSLPATGAQMGFDWQAGSSFYADPVGWVLDGDIPVTNPNIFSFGFPGTGKSGTTKAFALRMMPFGVKTLILGDNKDEYEPLCRALGVNPIALGPGLPARVNPLAFGPLRQGWQQLDAQEAQARATIVFGRWLTLIAGLVGSQKVGQAHVPFGPVEDRVVKVALEELTGYTRGASQLRETTLPQLWAQLDSPTQELIAQCRYADRQTFFDETRLLRDALARLCQGVLAGLFDDHTNIDLDWRAPIQSLSLSRLEPLGDEAVGIALTCLNSWGRGIREVADPGDVRLVVRDEAWKQLRLGPEAVKSFDADLRLSRGGGTRGADIQFAIAHKPSDLLSAGDAGSQASMIAKDLLDLVDVKILHGQKPKVAGELDAMLGLGAIARTIITGWGMQRPGRALWMVGESHYQVQTVLHPIERELAWTNSALEGAEDNADGRAA